MNVNRFSIRESIRFGWDTMRANLGFFIVFLIIIYAIYMFFGIFTGLFEKRLPVFALVFNLGSLFAGIVINLVMIKVALKFCDDDERPVSEVISFSGSLLFKFVKGYFLYALIVTAGFLLLIVPGIIWMVKYQYILYFIVDKESGAMDALRKSGEITDGVKWKLFAFLLVLGLINMAGALFFLIGLFATVPTSIVAMAHVYRKLSGSAGPGEASPFQAPDTVGR